MRRLHTILYRWDTMNFMTVASCMKSLAEVVALLEEQHGELVFDDVGVGTMGILDENTCVVCGKPGNEATHIGIMCDEHLRRLQPICDFCSGDGCAFRYAAGNFKTIIGTMSNNDWLACEICHDLIESARWQELAARSTDSYLQGRDSIEDGERALVRTTMLQLHRQFRDHRTGKAIRMGSA